MFARRGTVLWQEPPSVALEDRRIARPVLDMDLRAFELLDASHQEEIELEHNVNDGFIVAVVYDDSTAARLGISQGDIIVSYNGLHDFTLHKLVVYDPVRRATRSITFPLEFSDASEQDYRTMSAISYPVDATTV
ncbi:hypothetical protein E2562_037738 [Oryza meyeriana var. granulata]|uniref:PDZ domain-containing protein n=1 Tax=Oryza meyeriana var. granulata TaxID=110450 RepID=A0A6G1C3V5_9ORYZ|nr:hypothetical protein E2562_037738 [Oryza meyeriana var. granulata]